MPSNNFWNSKNTVANVVNKRLNRINEQVEEVLHEKP